MKDRRKLAWAMLQTMKYVFVEYFLAFAVIHRTCSWKGGTMSGKGRVCFAFSRSLYLVESGCTRMSWSRSCWSKLAWWVLLGLNPRIANIVISSLELAPEVFKPIFFVCRYWKKDCLAFLFARSSVSLSGLSINVIPAVLVPGCVGHSAAELSSQQWAMITIWAVMQAPEFICLRWASLPPLANPIQKLE